jgi:NADH:ubiquinone reductase (H+-translocating)
MSEILKDARRPSAQASSPQDKSLPTVGAPGAKRKRIVIVGAGFAGIAAARALKRSDADVVLIDRRNHHIFQPLLDASEPGVGIRKIQFDYLIIAAGMQPSYFGHDEFARFAPGLKNLTDAETIRAKILSAYELADATDDDTERARQMTFVLVGGGPTGVELAASMAQLATITLRGQFQRIDPAKSSIILVEGGKRILPTFAEGLAKKAAGRLEKLGVRIMAGVRVEKVDADGVVAGGKGIPSATVLWTAGVAPSPIVTRLGAKSDHAGRVSVGPFMNVEDTSNVFVVGDASSVMSNGRPVPGVAQAAIQEGRYVGRLIARQLEGRNSPHPFRYFDRGNMAVVGKSFAILESGRLRMSGFITWLAWVVLHLMSLPQLQNRLRVRTEWLWAYQTGQRTSRLIPDLPRPKNEPSA